MPPAADSHALSPGARGWWAWLSLPLLLTPVHGAPPPAKDQRAFQPVPKSASVAPLPPSGTGPIEFAGNRSFKPDDFREPLAESIKEIQAQGLTKPRADDAAYFLSVFYRKQGFPDVDVAWEIRGSRLVLTIKEGARCYLDKVVFQGNRAEPSKLLMEYMVGDTQANNQKKSARQPQIPFVQADIQAGVARVRGYYESEGRLDAVIGDPEITFSRDHTRATVLVKIVEGPHYGFAEPVFAGQPVFPRPELIEALGEPTANPFTTQRANTMQHNLEYYFKLHGYYAAEVSVAAAPKAAQPGPRDSRRVPVTFTIKPGALYRFDGETITGLDRLKPAFVHNRFKKLHGQVYSPTKLDERYREVLRTGLFRNLRINTVPLPTNEVRIDLTAEEAKAKEIGFSIGYSTYEGALLGLRLGDRDFQGRGRPLSLQIDYTTRALRAELLYVDPWLFESDFNLRARIFAQGRTEIGYAKQEEGVRADLSRKIGQHYDASGFLQVKNVNVTNEGMSPIFLGATSYQIATVGLTQTFDYRDSPVNPSKGWVVSNGIDADTIASQLAFARATGRLSWYIPVRQKYLLALGARGGILLPVSSSIPIDERFFNGGATTVRSFSERELGPKDPHHFPIGGEAFTVFNAELEIPVHDALYGAVFADAGNLIQSYQQASFNNMRYAIGVGIRYKLPIGPVRLDVGFNPDPDRKNLEKWGAVNFSFGFAF